MVDNMVRRPSLELQRKPTFEIKLELLQTLFRAEYVGKRLRHFDEYFAIYERELAKLNTSLFQRYTSNIVPHTHQDLAKLIAMVKDSEAMNKSDILALLERAYPNNDQTTMMRSVQLCLKVWLMIDVEEPSSQLQLGLPGAVTWEPDQNLRALLSAAIPISRWDIDAKDSRLHPSFTAVFMTDVCNLRLEWTDVLTRHLWLDRRERKLHIFNNKAFVAAHLDTIKHKASSTTASPFPEKLLIETIWTLNLLFPHWDQATNRFLERHGQLFHQFGPFESPPVLNLLQFEHWRDRLAEVHDVIFLAPPVSWAQLLKDRRNPQQYWTFWIALVILILTFLSTVATIAQAVAAFKNN